MLKSTIHHFMHQTTRLATHVLFPPSCLICATSVVEQYGTFCHECFNNLHVISAPHCTRCGNPFDYVMPDESLCSECMITSSRYDVARALWQYNECSALFIKKLKFNDNPHYARYASTLLYNAARPLFHTATLLLPVPLHAARLRTRKYNQSMELTRHLHRLSSVPMAHNILIRTRNTAAQTTLPAAQRLHNVNDAFAVRNAMASHIHNAHIILVDDVYTTGATVNACADALKKAGASWVGVVTLAKTSSSSY